jgi:hypothetical protein
MTKFVSLGTECVEFLKAARASQGKFFCYVVSCTCLICLSMVLYSAFFPLFRVADALSAVNARILSLEAKLEASRKAWDIAAAAKTAAEKSTKSAVAKAKKAEKALTDADREHAQREQAIVNRLNQISALAGGKYHAFLFLAYLLILLLTDVCSLIFCLCLFVSIENTGVSLAPLQLDDEDPLMAAVNLLESNWISIQEILELARRVLTRIFVRLWPKKKADVPTADLKKLATAFDIAKDPILLMKSRSVKRAAEGAIALAYAHGEEVDWEKVSSSRGRLSLLWRLLRLPLRPLRLLRQVRRCPRQAMVLLLPHLLPPWSLLLRWRRLRLPL